MEIKTVKNEESNTIIIDKSKFISYIFYCANKEQATQKIDGFKALYPDATHICYAYILYEDGVLLYKQNDDGEPSQTAGAPILNVLKKKELVNTMCVVVRYFGGVKLGAGGLTRAYSNAASTVLLKSEIVNYVDSKKYSIKFPYDKIKEVDGVLKQFALDIEQKKFEEEVEYTLIIQNDSIIEELKSKLEYLKANILFLKSLYSLKK